MRGTTLVSATCSAVLTRADGTRIDLGVIASTKHKSFLFNKLTAVWRRWRA